MSQDKSRRRFRDVFLPKSRREKDKSDTDVRESPQTYSEELPLSDTLEPAVAECSLWALAYQNLQKRNPELIRQFEFHLGLSTTDAGDGKLALFGIDQVSDLWSSFLRNTFQRHLALVTCLQTQVFRLERPLLTPESRRSHIELLKKSKKSKLREKG